MDARNETERVATGDLSGDSAVEETLGDAPSTWRNDKPLSRGQVVGRYVVVNKLGAGGMGTVYRAFDPDLDRSVALKLVAVDAFDVVEERTRLLREAQAMARLSHPNVIPVFDVGVEHDAVFVAMELVDGATLGKWVAQTPRPSAEVLEPVVQAGRGLAAAHRAGLIHRDFKPDNVIVGHDGRVRVLDFGLARQTARTDLHDDEVTEELRTSSTRRLNSGRSLDQSMTAAGTVMGTPAYMSPEQHLGAATTAASDQFSFCVTLWEALYGERPFEGTTMAVLTANVLQGRLREVPATVVSVPSWVHAAIVRGLCTDEAKRHPSMDALLDALTRDPGALRRRVLVVAVAGAAILSAGGLIGARFASNPSTEATPQCTGSQAAIDAVWSDERRDALHRAFDATGLFYAGSVWRKAAAHLDQYAATWAAAHTEACAATRITGEQSESKMDARIGCLTRQRQQLDALLHALATPDDAAVQRTIDAVRNLPPATRCADPTAGNEAAALPADPNTRQAIEDADAVLAAVRAQVALGHYGSARGLLAPVLATAQLLDHPPLTARTQGWLAEVESQSGSPKLARRALVAAFGAALVADDLPLQASLATELAHATGHREADLEGGTQWLSLGRALVRRQGGDPEREAELDSSEGAMLVTAGNFGPAIAAHERALRYWSRIDPAGLSTARVLDDLGSAEVVLGKIDAAVSRHTTSLQIRKEVYGPDHPMVALSERELGMALSKGNRDAEAIEPLQRALDINRRARGNDNTFVATSLDDLGRIERRRGNLDTALDYHREALGIWEATLGDPHPDVAVSLLNIGYTLVAAERPGEAVPVQRRALAMFEATVGGESPYVIYAANALGMAIVAADDPAGAIEPLQRALSLRGKVEVDPTLFGDTLYELARARWRVATTESERSAAQGLATEARDLFATQGERWSEQIANIDAWIAAPQ